MYITQTLSEIDHQKIERTNLYRKRTAAFQDWLNKLRPGETLPRGKFFKCKKPGEPIIIMDEFHSFFSSPMESLMHSAALNNKS